MRREILGDFGRYNRDLFSGDKKVTFDTQLLILGVQSDFRIDKFHHFWTFPRLKTNASADRFIQNGARIVHSTFQNGQTRLPFRNLAESLDEAPLDTCLFFEARSSLRSRCLYWSSLGVVRSSALLARSFRALFFVDLSSIRFVVLVWSTCDSLVIRFALLIIRSFAFFTIRFSTTGGYRVERISTISSRLRSLRLPD